MSNEIVKEPSKIEIMYIELEKMKSQLVKALPKHLTPDRMARLALSCLRTNPALLNCSKESVAAAVMTSAQLGLEIGVNGQAYMIPYRDTCSFVVGWRGLVDLVSRSGRGTVFTGVIYKDQKYTYTDGARRDLIVHNETSCIDSDDITHVYAIGWVKDASMPIIELWTVEKIKRHRDKNNKQGTSHYSFKFFEMYARKIPLLQVIKYMPMSVELSMAIEVSDSAEFGGGAIIDNGVVVHNQPGNFNGQTDLDLISDEIAALPNLDELKKYSSKMAREHGKNKDVYQTINALLIERKSALEVQDGHQ